MANLHFFCSKTGRNTVVLLFILLSSGKSIAQPFNCILGRPTATSITISILFNADYEVYWEYGTMAGNYSHNTTIQLTEKDVPLEFDLNDLLPDTKYYYHACYRLKGSTESFTTSTEYSFHTQRAKNQPFVFTIESDEHLYDKKGNLNLYNLCLQNQAAANPDFMLSLGDIFGDDHYPYTITSEELDDLHKYYRPFLGSICHSIPFYVCLGNHEGEFEYYLLQNPPNNMAVYATQWRKFYYPNPNPNEFYSGNTDIEPNGIGNPENYYAWTWGDALFVVLDVYRYQSDTSAKPKNWAWSIGLPQYQWLKSTLENNHSKFKFVFAHHVRGQGRGGITEAKLFEWGGYNSDGTTYGFTKNRPGWEMPIHQLMVSNKVTIFFQGHDHLFSHEVLDGVVYQEVPMPSDTTYELGVLANAAAYTTDIAGGSGHLTVGVTSDCVKVDFIRAYLPQDTLNKEHKNGEIGFSYSIGNCSSGERNEGIAQYVRLYPNPAGERLHIDAPGNQQVATYTLMDQLGRTVIKTQQTDINVKHLPNGIYILNIALGSTLIQQKVFIMH